jgi:hypothetical protein
VDISSEWNKFMLNGDFESAWQLSDSILHTQNANENERPRHFQRIWNGQNLENKKVLIRCYHGLGDTIQFIRYVPKLELIASQTILWIQPELISLVETMKLKSRILPLHNGSIDADYDIDIELMELPYIFRTTLADLPADVPYFDIEKSLIRKNGKIAIGIVWKSGDWDHKRSIPYPLMSSLNDLQNIQTYIIQRGAGLDERNDNRGIVFGSENIFQAAKNIRALDLIITVDTMIPHLAGALAVPVWLLLNSRPDWRWMLNRTDSPWYPTMRIFRQKQFGIWDDVIEEVKQKLRNFKH